MAPRPGLSVAVRLRLRRLALYAGLAAVGLYLLAATAGYTWLRFVRKNEQITFTQVVFLRWHSVRRGVAATQFAQARADWDTKSYQSAYLLYSSAMRNDPANLAGRLSAGRFMAEVGAVQMALNILEDGLARTPDEPELIRQTFDLLLSTGRELHALELLKRSSFASVSGETRLTLRTYEVRATLLAHGPESAARVLAQYPELEKNPGSRLAVAQVWWETKNRMKAIQLLEGLVRSKPADFAPYAKLTEWYLATGSAESARDTAKMACQVLPREIAARVLLIETSAAYTFRGKEWVAEIEDFCRDHAERPEALAQLATLAGRKGWPDLARHLYEVGGTRGIDLRVLALSCADAWMTSGKFKEAESLLVQIDGQSAASSGAFSQQIRQRQILVAAALGASENVRDYARRLVAAQRNDPYQLEVSRRLFEKRGIAEALAEFGGRPAVPASSAQP